MSMIGHNKGPSMEAGHGFRKLSWTKARAELMPTLPLEVVRLRVARAKRLGLPYKTYASIRAASGRDIVAFLFSGNALAVTPSRIELPARIAERLAVLPAGRLAGVYAPLEPETVLQENPTALTGAGRAPAFTASWRDVRAHMRAIAHGHSIPLDGLVLVPATVVEQEWCGAGGLAGFVPASRFFEDGPNAP